MLRELSCQGWSILRADGFQQALPLIIDHDCRVALAFLDKESLSLPLYMKRYPELASLHWVMLIESLEQLSDKARDLIFGSCFAYRAAPHDVLGVGALLEGALDMARLQQRHAIGREHHRYDDLSMVGDTPIMQHLYRTIHKVATVEAPVLITGESGTGKELTARAIHDLSLRHRGPFNVVNCGALPAGLIQSELFGHEKGAFTGANQRQTGIIENSQNGTLFLDEIGDLPLDLQVNLLRFLETLTVSRLGGKREIVVDVRVLSATHVDLEKAIAKGEFREDLYHRLNVLQVETPALREHPEDIEPLARFFFRRFSSDKPLKVRDFSHESLIVMRQHHWPGNIREMVNRVRRAMIMCEHRLIGPADLGLERRNGLFRDTGTLQKVRDTAECEAIKAALARNRHMVLHAARELGISRVTLYRLIEKHGIERSCGSDATTTDSASTSRTIQLT